MKTISSIAAVCLCGLAATAGAQVPQDYDFNFITIGDVGNEAYEGSMLDKRLIRGGGSVAYEYRIAESEIRTSDWVHFANLARTHHVPLNTAFGALHWGAGRGIDPQTGDEVWFQISKESGDFPVAGISWWAAATYCNWLHNGKAETAEAFLTGAYDLSTFGRDPADTRRFTDQTTRSPGAKYWIPSIDEWLKAAHYDPDKDGPGQGGWWLYPNGSDTKPIAGIPGVGETSARLFNMIGLDAWDTPVGSYPETQSPWGLLDVSGGASEWTEVWAPSGDPIDRFYDGTSMAFYLDDEFDPDRIGLGAGSQSPDGPAAGLRLASSVPSPSGGISFVAMLSVVCINRKRKF